MDLDDVITDEARRLRASTDVDHPRPARARPRAGTPPRAVPGRAQPHRQRSPSRRHRRQSAPPRQGDRAVLEVANDGEAIAPADIDRIFERFVRLEESRARDLGGSGLGLAIVQEVVRAHLGTVQVANRPAVDEPTDGDNGRLTDHQARRVVLALAGARSASGSSYPCPEQGQTSPHPVQCARDVGRLRVQPVSQPPDRG